MSTTSTIFQSGNLAVITGAASGIGLALATKCASHGMSVIMCDNHASNLAAAAKSTVTGEKVSTFEMDVSQMADYERLRTRIVEGYGGKIHLLALNAGIGLKGSWDDAAYFQKIMAVNLFGVINGLNILLPLVTSTSTSTSTSNTPNTPSPTSSSIIITGSKQGITNPPSNPAYNASKSALKTLTEHLAYDLTTSSPTTSVHLLVPGWTFTGLSGNAPFPTSPAKEKPKGAWSPEQVVEYLLTKMDERAFYIICPDEDVSEEMDKKRIRWAAEDVVQGRPPLTRWREEWKGEAEEWMKRTEV